MLSLLFWLWAASIQYTPDQGFEVRGVDAARLSSGDLSKLKVFVDGVEGAPAMMGTHAAAGDSVRFTPRFPLQPGLRYRAEWPGAKPLVVAIPKRELKPVARLERLFPSASRLPANQLKIYLHFSHPMSRREAYKRLHLIDDQGKEVALPFLEIEEELWDREARRLTVLFDPGRIKRGLVPHNEAGPAMIAGRSYELVVDREWQDANGAPMVEDGRKRFQVVEDDRTPLTLATWRVSAPAAGTLVPLHVDLPEPADAALLERMIWIERDAQRVDGAVLLSDEERRWSFTPAAPWVAGAYRLVVAVTIEDLAGNRLDRKFDVDTFERVEMRVVEKAKSMEFRVNPPPIH